MKKRWFTTLAVAASVFMTALPVHATGEETIFVTNSARSAASQLYTGSTAEVYIEGWSTSSEINWYILDQYGTTVDYGTVGTPNRKYEQFARYYPGSGSLQLVMECTDSSFCDGSGNIWVHW
ncbi:hypothetical protein [Paenibacillus sp. y28]|uniref:hypothetical protein n=1 Tax=Paenibacillus sp. y28 TaxID=3129110 RepID=UPI0030160803